MNTGQHKNAKRRNDNPTGKSNNYDNSSDEIITIDDTPIFVPERHKYPAIKNFKNYSENNTSSNNYVVAKPIRKRRQTVPIEQFYPMEDKKMKYHHNNNTYWPGPKLCTNRRRSSLGNNRNTFHREPTDKMQLENHKIDQVIDMSIMKQKEGIVTKRSEKPEPKTSSLASDELVVVSKSKSENIDKRNSNPINVDNENDPKVNIVFSDNSNLYKIYIDSSTQTDSQITNNSNLVNNRNGCENCNREIKIDDYLKEIFTANKLDISTQTKANFLANRFTQTEVDYSTYDLDICDPIRLGQSYNNAAIRVRHPYSMGICLNDDDQIISNLLRTKEAAAFMECILAYVSINILDTKRKVIKSKMISEAAKLMMSRVDNTDMNYFEHSRAYTAMLNVYTPIRSKLVHLNSNLREKFLDALNDRCRSCCENKYYPNNYLRKFIATAEEHYDTQAETSSFLPYMPPIPSSILYQNPPPYPNTAFSAFPSNPLYNISRNSNDSRLLTDHSIGQEKSMGIDGRSVIDLRTNKPLGHMMPPRYSPYLKPTFMWDNANAVPLNNVHKTPRTVPVSIVSRENPSTKRYNSNNNNSNNSNLGNLNMSGELLAADMQKHSLNLLSTPGNNSVDRHSHIQPVHPDTRLIPDGYDVLKKIIDERVACVLNQTKGKPTKASSVVSRIPNQTHKRQALIPPSSECKVCSRQAEILCECCNGVAYCSPMCEETDKHRKAVR